MDYDTPRRCLPHNLSYPNYIYSERNAPLALSHNTRENPRGYPIGGPVGGMHGRASIEEPMMETGQARRRIAVAVSQQVLRDQSAYFLPERKTQLPTSSSWKFCRFSVLTFINPLRSAQGAVRGRSDAAVILEMVLAVRTVDRLELFQ